MSKYRILEVIRQGLIGGGESHVIDIIKYIDRDLFEPMVLSFTEGPMVETIRALDTEVFVIPTIRPFDFRKWEEVRSLVSSKRINLIHAHGTRAQSNVFRPAKSLGLPLVYTVHGWSFHDDQSLLIKVVRQRLEKILINASHQVINVSLSNRNSGIEELGNFSSAVVKNGIDLEKFQPKGDQGKKDELNIPSDRIVVGCVMRMTHQKNPLGMIRAFKKAQRQNQNLHLIMVGDGELMEPIRRLVKELAIPDYVSLPGNRTDVPEILAIVDIFCLPSFWEGLSLGLLEAMAASKAIIASRVDGTSEVINNGENGILVEPGNEEQLADAICSLSKDTALRNEIGRAALAYAREHHDVKEMVRAIEVEYLRLLKT